MQWRCHVVGKFTAKQQAGLATLQQLDPASCLRVLPPTHFTHPAR
jgi:hypothetical protein